jgi:hypothetical protein
MGRIGRTSVHLVVCAAAAAAACGVASPAAWATSWPVTLQSNSRGEGHAQTLPAPPANPIAQCTATALQITVSWSAVPHAATYTVYQSTTSASGPYTAAATGLTTTTWTSSVPLAAGTYWYEITATIGTTWISAASTATAPRTITVVLCT